MEEVTFRDMTKRVKYVSRPGRPTKRVSKPTREMILKLKSYQNRADAAKDRGLFNRAKEVWDATLFSMDTKLYVRELRSMGGGFLYFLSFDGALPNMAVEVDKKIPKNDWQYFADEYQYATYVNFQKRFVEEDNEGKASDEGGDEDGIDPSYISKTGKSIAPKAPRSFSMTGSNSNYFEITNHELYDWERFTTYDFEDSKAQVEQSVYRKYGTVTILAPSLRQVMKKLSKEGEFFDENWDFDGFNDDSKINADKIHVVKGPNGILPKSDAYDEWIEKVEEQFEDDSKQHFDDNDVETSWTIIIKPPYNIKDDETGQQIIFDPDGSVRGDTFEPVIKDYNDQIPTDTE